MMMMMVMLVSLKNYLSLSGVRQVILGSVKYFIKLKGRNYFCS